MIDLKTISSNLRLGDDGIWYGLDTGEVSYPATGYDECFSVEDNSFWFKHRNNCIISAVNSFPPTDNGTIFDIGGGNGFVSLGLSRAGFNVALVEPGSKGAHYARTRGVGNVICATTDSAKFEPSSLPAVGLFDVVEHIEDDVFFLGEIRKLLKENGMLYITVPAYSFLWSAQDITAGHYRRYTLNSIAVALESAGFQIEFSTYIFRLLPLPIFLMRTLPYKLGLTREAKKTSNISRDHVAKEGVSRKFLDILMRVELKNLDQKKMMKFGGSCLVVAKAST